MQCICGNFIPQATFSMKPQFLIELCKDCMASSNSKSIWNKEYVCEHISGDESLFNKDQNCD
mgnify:CR=1 FL=1